MAKYTERLKAREMRKTGLSLGDISHKVGVCKSTVSLWCRDIHLTDLQNDLLKKNVIKAGLKGRMMGAEMNRRKKQERLRNIYEEAEREIKYLSKRDLFIIGAALYWGEGCKNGSRFIFINSDPGMIKVMYRFLREVLKLPKDRFHLTVQINEIHKPRIDKVLNFWSSLLNLPLSQFGKAYFVKTSSKKVYDNYDSYYGILRMRVDRGSDLQYKMLGLIEAIKKS